METIQNFPEITKKDFPLLNKNLKSNEQIIYLDHAATTQKPIQVLKKIDEYYKNFNANVHRGAHQLSAKATEEFENARYLISKYIKANSAKEIIFTRNATEAINLVARSWGEYSLKENDEILLSIMEHHSNCGPTGIGFLWSRKEILEKIPPLFGGGEMIQDVFEETSTWAELPHKFEAGTPAIAEAIGLAEAINYINNIGLNEIHEYEKTITKYLFEKLNQIENIEIIGPSPELDPDRASLATFHIKNIHSNDIAEILDSKGICIRSGHHCCQPLHRYIGIKSTARISMNFTTNKEEIDIFIEKLKDTIDFLRINS